MSDVNVFDFDNTEDLTPALAAMVEETVRENTKREAFIELLGKAPRALSYKELYVAAHRSGMVEPAVNAEGEAILDEETGKQKMDPALSTVANWVRKSSYGAVQVSRGKYAKAGSDADNGERYKHVAKPKEGSEEVAPVNADDLDDLNEPVTDDLDEI